MSKITFALRHFSGFQNFRATDLVGYSSSLRDNLIRINVARDVCIENW